MTSVLNVQIQGVETDIYPSQAPVHNIELHNAVNDSLTVVGLLQEEAESAVDLWKKRWASHCDDVVKKVMEFDRDLCAASEQPYGEAELNKEGELHYDSQWLEKYGTKPVPIVSTMQPVLDEMYSNTKFTALKRTDYEGALKPVISACLPLNSFNLLDTLLEMCDFQHADALALLRAEFANSSAQLAAMEAQLSQTVDERDACLRAEDIVGAEERMQMAQKLLKDIIDIVRDRISRSILAREEVSEFQKNLTAFLGGIRIDEATNVTVEYKRKVHEDMDHLEALNETKVKAASERREKYAQRSKEFRAKMDHNEMSQLAVWDEIKAILAKLPNLAQERQELVVAHKADTRNEREAEKMFGEYLTQFEQRSKELKYLSESLDAAEELLNISNSYQKKANEFIRKKEFPVQLSDIEKGECVRYLNAYKQYVLQAGEAVFRREQRLENTRRMLRSTEFQAKHAMDSLDSELPMYRQQMNKLQKTQTKLSEAIEEIKAEMDEQQEDWTHVEQRLEEFDVEYDPPALALQQLQRELLRQHVEAVDELTNAEQRMLDQEKTTVRKIHNSCEAAKNTVEEKKQTRRAARTISPPAS